MLLLLLFIAALHIVIGSAAAAGLLATFVSPSAEQPSQLHFHVPDALVCGQRMYNAMHGSHVESL